MEKMTKQEVLEVKEEMDYAEKLWGHDDKQQKSSKKRLKKAKHKFREAEVQYVLENLEYLVSKDMISRTDIDMFLVHCLKVLEGEHDGVVFDFSEYYEQKEEEKEEEDGSE